MNPQPPDERVLREHLNGARFQDGFDRGRWKIMSEIDWPIVVVAITAAPRKDAPTEYFLRFDLTGYPESAPTATPWNPSTGAVLESALRPKGEKVGAVFTNQWEHGKALYAPFDRVALGAHPEWRTKFPYSAWNSERDLAWLLQIVHEMLNNHDYKGV